MKWNILHESRGRIRLHLRKPRMSLAEADQLQDYLTSLPGVRTAAVYERTCDVVIVYTESRAGIVRGLAAFRFDTEALAEVPANSPRAVNREYQEKLVNMTIFHLARKLFLPAPLRMVYTLVRSVPYIFRGLRCVFRRKLEVEVLDALSIGVSMLRGDFGTAGSVMFLLRLGELLEEWTRKKSLGDLARCMSLNVDRVWQQTAEGEVLVPISQVCAGDAIVVHTGSVIPLDGRVLDGEASVNQASLTGEAEPVRKSEGAVVYAGTVVEEGQITVTVEQQAGNGRYDQIVKMIENSEKLKSASETRAAALADKLVPYSLLGTAVTYALTRNATRAISILMVDFSCALKLSMPLAVLSAMRECGSYHITVKGGKYLEALANADTIVFDKTGTLTHATPTVVQVVPFGTRTEDEVLQIAACLEEHYPHSMANAVVQAAAAKGIRHDEMHSEVRYFVAHGIAGQIGGEQYFLPVYFETLVFLYNKALWQGDIPTTTEDLYAYMQANTDTAAGTYAVVNQHSTAYNVSPFINGFGGYILNEEGQPGLNDPKTIEGVEYNKKFAALQADGDYNTVTTLFNEGKAAAIIGGPWLVSGIRDAGIDFGVASLSDMTLPNGNPLAPYAGVQGVGVLKTGAEAHPEAIGKVLAALASPEAMAAAFVVQYTP